LEKCSITHSTKDEFFIYQSQSINFISCNKETYTGCVIVPGECLTGRL